MVNTTATTTDELLGEVVLLRARLAEYENGSHASGLAEIEACRRLVESSENPMFAKDVHGRYVTVNSAFTNRLGKRPEDIIGRQPWDVFPDLLAQTMAAEDAEVTQTGRSLTTEHSIPGVDGPKTFEVRKTPIFDTNGKIVGLTGVATDINGQMKVQEALEESERTTLKALEDLSRTQESLVQAEKLSALGELTAGVAHELNNPLTGVLGITQLLVNQTSDPVVREQLALIEMGAKRASKIVQNLLSFSRKQKLEASALDLNEILKQTLELKVYDLLSNQIELNLDLAPILPDVWADESQMQSLFLNLINNAQDAITSTDGSGNIRVATEFVDEVVRIRVTDDGPGIMAEHVTRLFDPFFTTKDPGKGTGLGLSICHGIVQQHKGEMWVESDLGSGATFVLEFPPAPPSHVQPTVPVTTLDFAHAEFGQRILVIDDEEVVRAVLQAALSRTGYDVQTLASPRDALPMLENNDFDLILADLKNPDMSGKDFFEELGVKMPDLVSRVVFITGDAVSPGTKEFLEGAGRPVIEKPFELAYLQKEVALALH